MTTDELLRGRPLRIKLGHAGRKVFRVDRPEAEADPSDPGPAAAVENGRLFDTIWRAIRADESERRGSPRHLAVEPDVWVGWWCRDNFEAVDGRMINLSRGGALVVVGHKPPKRQSVWVYKEVDSAVVCVRGEVVGYNPAPDGAYAVRFRFAVPCPTLLCQAVVCPQPAPRSSGALASS
jgi:hypothetical protein